MVEGCTDDANAFLLIRLGADVVSAEANHRDLLAGSTEGAVRHTLVALGPGTRTHAGKEGGAGG